MNFAENQTGITGTNKSLSRYLKDIRHIPRISIGDEIKLAQRIKKGDQVALNNLIKANLRFVITVAKQYQGHGIPLQDLINEGNLGLVQAAMRFDETKGYKFITYAVWWIKQSIIQALQDNSRTIRLPQNKSDLVKKIHKTRDSLQQELGREPSCSEIADSLEIDSMNVEQALKYSDKIRSLDLEQTNKTNLYNIVSDNNSNSPENEISRDVLNNEMLEALNSLTIRESEIIKLYFGINREKPATLDEIASSYKLTRERIRQIKEKGLSKLRHKSRSHLLRLMMQ